MTKITNYKKNQDGVPGLFTGFLFYRGKGPSGSRTPRPAGPRAGTGWSC